MVKPSRHEKRLFIEITGTSPVMTRLDGHVGEYDVGLMKLYYIYILASRPGGALYIGVTNNLSRRVWEHKQGSGGQHTRRYKINVLVYYESYADVRDALQRETSIKRWPRAWKTRLILSMNPTWRDLYEELNN